MKRYMDENLKANEEAVIRENNGPEIMIKLYDNVGINWLYHYGKSSASCMVLIDDTMLYNLLNRADSKVVAKNANSKIYDIRIANAVDGDRLNLIVESLGRYRLGDNSNTNIVCGINNKMYTTEEVSDKYFVLLAQNKMKKDHDEKIIDIVDGKPLKFLRKNISKLKEENALIYFTSETMKKAYHENVFCSVRLIDDSEEKNIIGLKKEDIKSVKLKDKENKLTYTFLKDVGGENWVLTRVYSNYADKSKVIYELDTFEYANPTIINCAEYLQEKE